MWKDPGNRLQLWALHRCKAVLCCMTDPALLCCAVLYDRPCFSCRITLPCFDYLYSISSEVQSCAVSLLLNHQTKPHLFMMQVPMVTTIAGARATAEALKAMAAGPLD